MAATPDPTQIRAILLDIEGTTTPVDFVYGTLFPFARARVEEFLWRHYVDQQVSADLNALQRQRAADAELFGDVPAWREESREARLSSAAAYLRWLMDRDRKVTLLKSIQGKIWEAGYRSGELRGQVYPDVASAFARWRTQGKTISIFSSGSVLAQKLLFASSTAGDLTPFITSCFDTTTGPKQDEQSYRRIAEALSVPPRGILFLSDAVAELDAARGAGAQTILCVRPGSQGEQAASRGMDESVQPTIHSFDEVFP